MKNAILFMLLSIGSTSTIASDLSGTTKKEENEFRQKLNQRNGNNQKLNKGERCADKIGPLGSDPKPYAAVREDCEKLSIIATVNGESVDAAGSRTTADGKITCKQVGGFTADYKSCKNVSFLYDSVVIAEQGMFAAQKLTIEASNSKAVATLAAKTAQGDGQNAAIDATIARNELNTKLYKTQATSYISAVGAIAGSVGAWKGKNAFVKDCQRSGVVQKVLADNKVKISLDECKTLLESKKDSEEVFSNGDAKMAFIAAVGSFVQKAAEAKQRAGLSEFVAKKLGNISKIVDDSETMLDPCFNNPTGTGCSGATGQGNISSGNFQGSSVGFGAGTGAGGSFDFGAGNGVGDIAADAPTGALDNVAGVISPFEEQAKLANGILNPAAAASVSAGNGSSAAGAGGGGGGGGGGGSASLGDDLAGATADANKDPDITTNKLSGKYKNGKGGGFQAVKGGKEDANPFASLFDTNASAGGIEEDRSIASESGEGSGLFQKISKKYGQIQQEKRLDNQALE